MEKDLPRVLRLCAEASGAVPASATISSTGKPGPVLVATSARFEPVMPDKLMGRISGAHPSAINRCPHYSLRQRPAFTLESVFQE
ncbi:hypothetical protein DNK06_17495 [Pseudomonas daroniae]|uniref:Uncharacterized protein n=1 Tax=Phytopseudomonas daroniae TaxID=2487519 RepID=A0A4Q9QIL6_9GAMM|nr:hypothetical protein DNK06_17495 [Pseudomonas daroniae]TBU80554.1 hypothetical protein DNK31_16270 [Pseudomonas sp. FRB 228]TBU89621.1 hypothetical protein DNJ99_15925 [Pseudomonas daroniae]